MKRSPCIECGRPTRGNRCVACIPAAAPSPYADPVYRANRRVVLATATRCGICHEWFAPGDKITVDHIVPVAHGGGNELANLQAAHATCNFKSGGATRGQ